MASLSEKLELLLTVNTQGAVSQLETFAKSTEKATSSATESLKKYQSAAKTALSVGAAGVGVGMLLSQLGSSEEEAANQLKAAIAQVGQSYTDFEGRIEKTAAAQAEFGHTNAEAKDAITTLTVAYGDTGKALDEMQLVTDLAARKHISLADAATMVAKAHGGAGRLFKQFGIQVQQNTDGTKNYDGALTLLSEKLKGQASASADSFSGKLRELKAEAENIAASFGEKFGPAILGASTILTAVGSATVAVTSIMAKRAAATAAQTAADAEATAALEAETEAMAAFAVANADVIAAASGAAAAEELFSGALSVTTTNSAAAVASLYEMDTASTGLLASFGPLGLAAGAAAAAMLFLRDSAKSAAEEVKQAAGASDQELVNLFEHPAYKLAGSIRDVVKATKSAQEDWLKTFIDQGEQGLGTLERLRSALQGTHQDTTLVDAAIDQATTALHNTAAGADAARTALGGLNDTSGLESQKQAAEDLKKKLGDAKTELQSLYDLASGAPSADIAQQRAQLGVQSANQAVQDAQDALNKALAGTPADPQKMADAKLAERQAQEELNAALQKGDQLAADQARNRIAKAQADEQAASGSGPDPQKVAQARDNLARALLDQKQSVLDLADATTKAQTAQDALAGHLDSNVEKSQKSVNNLQFFASGMGDLAPAFQPYIDALQKAVDLQAQLEEKALEERAASGDKDAQAQLAQQRSQAQKDTGTRQQVGTFAAGGDFGPGFRIAGEQGPELQWTGPGGAGHIWTAQQTQQKLGKSSGYSVTFEAGSIVASDARETASELAHRLRIEAMLTAA